MQDEFVPVEYKNVIWTSDKGLAAAITRKGVRGVGTFQNPPQFEINFLFPDCPKVRRIIKAYLAGTLRVGARQYHWDLAETDFSEVDGKTAIEHYAKKIRY